MYVDVKINSAQIVTIYKLFNQKYQLHRYSYSEVLLKDKGNKLFIELDLYTSPVSPIKYISIGASCLNSYSAIDCRQEPQGGIGVRVGLLSDAAEIAIVTIN